MDIPLVDLKAQYKTIQKEIDVAVERVLERGWFIGGEDVQEFEKEFAAYLNVRNCISVNSGTDALILGIRALNLSRGDEVIVPANSFVATALGATENGLKPVFVDTDENDFGVDLEDLKKKITSRTKAIILVHLYGRADKIDEVQEIIKRSGKKIYLIEDACQAHGAYYNEKRVGNYGIFSAFSFYPGKNLGAYGDGGAIVTNDNNLAGKYKLLREYGQREKYKHDISGINSRLDTLQASVLRVKLKYLDQWNSKRQEIAYAYTELLKENLSFITVPKEFVNRKSIYHLYVIRLKEREAVLQFLHNNGVGASIHYPYPLYRQKAFVALRYSSKDFPKTEKIAREIISLPMYPELTKEMVSKVVSLLGQYYQK